MRAFKCSTEALLQILLHGSILLLRLQPASVIPLLVFGGGGGWGWGVIFPPGDNKAKQASCKLRQR